MIHRCGQAGPPSAAGPMVAPLPQQRWHGLQQEPDYVIISAVGGAQTKPQREVGGRCWLSGVAVQNLSSESCSWTWAPLYVHVWHSWRPFCSEFSHSLCLLGICCEYVILDNWLGTISQHLFFFCKSGTESILSKNSREGNKSKWEEWGSASYNNMYYTVSDFSS